MVPTQLSELVIVQVGVGVVAPMKPFLTAALLLLNLRRKSTSRRSF